MSTSSERIDPAHSLSLELFNKLKVPADDAFDSIRTMFARLPVEIRFYIYNDFFVEAERDGLACIHSRHKPLLMQLYERRKLREQSPMDKGRKYWRNNRNTATAGSHVFDRSIVRLGPEFFREFLHEWSSSLEFSLYSQEKRYGRHNSQIAGWIDAPTTDVIAIMQICSVQARIYSGKVQDTHPGLSVLKNLSRALEPARKLQQLSLFLIFDRLNSNWRAKTPVISPKQVFAQLRSLENRGINIKLTIIEYQKGDRYVNTQQGAIHVQNFMSHESDYTMAKGWSRVVKGLGEEVMKWDVSPFSKFLQHQWNRDDVSG